MGINTVKGQEIVTADVVKTGLLVQKGYSDLYTPASTLKAGQVALIDTRVAGNSFGDQLSQVSPGAYDQIGIRTDGKYVFHIMVDPISFQKILEVQSTDYFFTKAQLYFWTSIVTVTDFQVIPKADGSYDIFVLYDTVVQKLTWPGNVGGSATSVWTFNHTNTVTSLAVDGTNVFMGGKNDASNYCFRKLDYNSGNPIFSLNFGLNTNEYIYSLDCDGVGVLYGGNTGNATYQNFGYLNYSGTVIWKLNLAGSPITKVKIDVKLNQVYALNHSGQIYAYQRLIVTNNQNLIWQWNNPNGAITSILTMSMDDRFLYVGIDYNTGNDLITVIDKSNAQNFFDFSFSPGTLRRCESDGAYLWVATNQWEYKYYLARPAGFWQALDLNNQQFAYPFRKRIIPI